MCMLQTRQMMRVGGGSDRRPCSGSDHLPRRKISRARTWPMNPQPPVITTFMIVCASRLCQVRGCTQAVDSRTQERLGRMHRHAALTEYRAGKYVRKSGVRSASRRRARSRRAPRLCYVGTRWRGSRIGARAPRARSTGARVHGKPGGRRERGAADSDAAALRSVDVG